MEHPWSTLAVYMWRSHVASLSTLSLQHSHDRFSAACVEAGMRMSIEKTEVSHLSRNPCQCALQVTATHCSGGDVQVPWGGILSDGKRNKEINTRIGKDNAVLREIYHPKVKKWGLWELSSTTKRSAFNSVRCSIRLSYSHEP